MKKFHLLVVDDEWNMRNLLRIYLTKNGFEVTEARNGREALDLIENYRFDLLILDIMMPDMDGWEVCERIRETNLTPILMVTARTETKDKVYGLNLGADDYLIKPFDPEELIARVFALIRRAHLSKRISTDNNIIVHPGMTIDPERRQVLIQEQSVDFTPKEFDLLYLLAVNPQRVFSREILLERVWGQDYFGDIRTVDTHVKNIREKFRKAGLSYVPIQTVWGVGYKFQGTDERT
ncbi:response regulator transcription factor [Effusibacillus lacus]|uniref:DNA-binding response regulator n=1 Tax=Effusibacillus lacus TaxID=1348429 RepID=A0A292YR47_9BACL|nr:response regulator transcription factor [Effusibacillus lacus]TCS74988.1 two-component system response regulator ResD [Effusibacillus lacus]GAX91656.1 DNA-binding response regulator [Effusibacillus lacus]